MKKIKSNITLKNKLIILLCISFFILIFLGICINKKTIKSILENRIIKEELTPLLSYTIYDNQDEEKIKVLATISSESGIEYIENVNGTKIYGNGRNKIAIDYLFKKDEEKIIKIKENGKEEKEEKILLNDEAISNIIKVEKLNENIGYKLIEIKGNVENDRFKTYYQIGKNGQWIEGSGRILIIDYDAITNNLVNEDDTITITAMIKDTERGYIIKNSKQYEVDTTLTTANLEADSLLEAIEKYDFGTGKFNVSVKDEIYSLKVYSFEKDQKIDIDTTLGTEEDVGTASRYAQNMIVLKVDGDLTIEEGVTLTTYASASGHGGPKGMLIYCTGTLTNKGTISMTARGAKAEGQNVYLWQNNDGSYEYVPAVGGAGGESVASSTTFIFGKAGKKGINRQTGGGASGTLWTNSNRYGKTGAGAAGTSYSGGSGGGAVDCGGHSGNLYGGDGEANGGAGGYGLGNANAVSGRLW